MIEYGGLILQEDYKYENLICGYCGAHLGTAGWNKDLEWNEVEDSGWNFCPYCGEPLFD